MSGRGVAAAAQGADQLARGVRGLAVAADDLADRQAALHAAKAIADAKAQWTKTRIERELAAEGEAAGFARSMRADFDEYASQAVGMAPARARERMQAAFAEYGGRIEADALAFEATKRVSYRADLLLSTVEQNRNTLLNDPGAFEDLLADTLDAIDGAGLPEETARKLEREARAGLALSSTQGLITRNPGEALRRLNGGELDQYLDPDRKLALIRSAEAEQRSRAAEARAIQAARRQEYLVGLDDELAFIRAGNPPPADTPYSRDRLVAELGAETAEKVIAAREQAIAIGEDVTTVRAGSPAEIAERRAALAAATETPVGFRDAAERLATFDRALVGEMKALAEDPVRAVLTSSPFAERAPALLEDGDTEMYANVVLAEQYARGVPDYAANLLTVDQASATVAEVIRMPAADRGERMRALSETWGRHWPTVLRQLRENGLDPATYHAALVADDPVLSERVAALADVGADALAEGLPKAETNDLRLAVFEELADFRAAFEAADATGRAAAEFNTLYETAVGVAMQEFRAGNGDAAASAVERMIGRRYEVVDTGDVIAYIPKRYDADAIEEAARALKDPEHVKAFGVAPFGMEDGLAPGVSEARMLQAARNGRWVTNESASGLVLMVEVDGRMLPLTNRDGRRYEISFDAASLGASAVIQAGD